MHLTPTFQGIDETLRSQTKRMTIATALGTIMFLTKIIMPSPIDKMLIVVQAFLLAIGALILHKIGATYVGAIGGFLTALWRPSLAPFTFFFALLYGFLIDTFFYLLKVHDMNNRVKTGKIVVATTFSTTLTGFSSYYSMALLMELVPRNLLLEVIILAVGIASGAVAGYLAAVVWNKDLKNIRFK
jgi:hypothetical protein